MKIRQTLTWLILTAALLLSCNARPNPPAATPLSAAPTPEPNTIYISEILVGGDSNDDLEFIELFNPGDKPVDLNGWALFLGDSATADPQLLHRWEARADIPARGRYLLSRNGQDVGQLGDAAFELPLLPSGSLVLRNTAGVVVDIVGWGEPPSALVAGSPAPSPPKGQSLLRQPNEAGLSNGRSTGDNASDFALSAAPNPQNSGDRAPAVTVPLTLKLEMPPTVTPGAQFVVTITAKNWAYTGEEAVVVSVPVPAEFNAPGLEAQLTSGRLEGSSPMPPNSILPIDLTLIAPQTPGRFIFSGAYVEVAGQRAYAPLVQLDVTAEVQQ